MATPSWSYLGPEFYYQSNRVLAKAISISPDGQPPTLHAAMSEAHSAWGTKRKYGERASSHASSTGSTDSRLSENFEAFNSYGNSPPSMQVHAIFDSSARFTAFRRKKLRRDSMKKSNGGPSKSPGPPNPRDAYFKMRRLIQGEFQVAVHGEPIDQSSSCASISLDGKGIQAPGEPADTLTTDPPNRKPDRGRQILSRMRVAVVKWQTRNQFFEFTADPPADNEGSSIHTWRRRRAVADALFSTSSKGEEWAALVARRFTKTTGRQIAGLRAILRLRVEEEKSNMPGNRGLEPRPECSDRSYNLLNLVFLRSEPQSFFENVIPPVISSFMPRVDARVTSGYGRRVIRNAKPWTTAWLWGMYLLSMVVLNHAASTQTRTTIISAAKLILHVGMEALGSLTSHAAYTTRTRSDVSRLQVLYSVIGTCLNCGGEDTLHSVVPSVMILGPFVESCIDALCADGSMTCSALKALALLRNVPTIMEDILQSKMSVLATCCMDIVLERGLWKKSLLVENCRKDPFPLIPEEDAFDILCHLPQPTFPKALAAALADCPVCLDPSSQDHLKLFDMLEPLLWLSNMPSSIPEAHRALVDGDACEFLSKIILDSPQETWSWQDRAVWRVKGETITCLGNIIEKMDETELRSRLGEDVVKAIAEIRDNAEAPQAQRDQGTFTLIR
ncbi:hypothetical protein FRC04_003573 [Tulasnella sp. 424]|nr:hypothetical protein FRC04_003573 [Tulasnella sp. 424]